MAFEIVYHNKEINLLKFKNKVYIFIVYYYFIIIIKTIT